MKLVENFERKLDTEPWSDNINKEFYGLLNSFKTGHGLKFTTYKERNIVVKAISLDQGHWFKCKNGHFYCIGECGGAMETSICPDCSTPIGGNNHKLADNNSSATDFDQSANTAYSEKAHQGPNTTATAKDIDKKDLAFLDLLPFWIGDLYRELLAEDEKKNKDKK